MQNDIRCMGLKWKMVAAIVTSNGTSQREHCRRMVQVFVRRMQNTKSVHSNEIRRLEAVYLPHQDEEP